MKKTRPHRAQPGTTPGIESMDDLGEPPAPGTVHVQCIDYGPDQTRTQAVTDLGAFLRLPRPDRCPVRWLNVDGLHPYVVNQLRQSFGFHTLAAEDVLRLPQRPKLETYEDHLFVVARMPSLRDGQLCTEQVSFFLFRDCLVTFQETAGDIWDPIRERLRKSGSRLRRLGASYLLYALLDATIDHAFPILEAFGDQLEGLEEEVAEHPTTKLQRQLHRLKRDLARLRRFVWPMREVTNQLCREETAAIAPEVRTYFRDVYDHTVQVMDMVESCRDTASSLTDLYMSAVSNRMNEVMKVLTIMASFFIPITFVAGVYGMNFEVLPELRWKYSYAGFWLICLSISASLAWFFIRKGWIGRK
ncbi:MAG TPA: magnesium/cobalt transporter CorA [Acidobacteriota bacterium]